MALTLDDLRTYAVETAASDPSGATSDREVQKWINQAFQAIWKHPWRWALRSGRVMIPPVETGSNLAVTQGSLSVSLSGGEVFEPKYLSEEWAVSIEGQTQLLFRLGEISSPATAQLLAGQEWLQASDTATYTWAKDRYPLPEDANTQGKLLRVADAVSYGPIHYQSPMSFDSIRQSAAAVQNANPVYYTVRHGKIEIWPLPGTAYRALEFTYQTKPPAYLVSDEGTTAVDWPEEWSDLLETAITVRASLSQGKNAPISYPTALHDYQTRFRAYRGEDSGSARLLGPMSPEVPGQRGAIWREGAYPSQTSIPDS